MLCRWQTDLAILHVGIKCFGLTHLKSFASCKDVEEEHVATFPHNLHLNLSFKTEVHEVLLKLARTYSLVRDEEDLLYIG
jgi:hypothetical protein